MQPQPSDLAIDTGKLVPAEATTGMAMEPTAVEAPEATALPEMALPVAEAGIEEDAIAAEAPMREPPAVEARVVASVVAIEVRVPPTRHDDDNLGKGSRSERGSGGDRAKGSREQAVHGGIPP